jgi:1-acyl-sn-glycerol-3-phosphate acyltransferase
LILYRTLELGGYRPLARALLRIDLRGAERVPATGPVVVAANHESIWDPFVLGAVIRRPIRFMAKAELWRHPLLAAAMNGFGTFPVQRGGGDVTALRRAVELLERGEAIGVFPQGTSKLELPRRYQRGAARLALETGAALLPVRLTGTRRLLRPGLPKVRIDVLAPIAVERCRPTVASAKLLTARLEEAIAG